MYDKGVIDMAKAIDVANFFVDMANCDPDDCMTNLRVNKLLYFAQAWSLVRLGRPLFDEDIQAWTYGPVVPSVYQAFKACGRERIQSVFGDYSADVFSGDELSLLLDVLNEYGKYTSPALVGITHKEGSPWREVFTPNANRVIGQEALRDYFRQETPLPAFDAAISEEGDYAGYRDADGYLVLPADMDDAE